MCNKVKAVTTHELKKHFGGTIVIDGIPPHAAALEKTPEQITGFERPGMAVMVSAYPQKFVWMEWGLLPRNLDSMPNSRARKMPILNARAESVFDLPSFRDSIRHRRCIVPLEGFYEYQHRDVPGQKKKEKQAYYIEHCSGLLFAAGIWDEYRGEKTFAILTTAANPTMAKIHNTQERQPHAIDQMDWVRWFSPLTDEEVKGMLAVYPDESWLSKEYKQP